MGIDGVHARISEIQSRILALQAQGQQGTATVASTRTSGTTATGGDSFASYLQQAVSAGPTATASAQSIGQTYQLNSKGIPTELAKYGNGHIPASALQQVGNTSHRLWAPAAESLTRMMADAQRDGVHIGISESYRPYSEQVDLARRKGLYSQGGLAAKPGTSEHGWGMAADLDLNSQGLAWMRKHAAEYGFVNNVSRESWHWAYRPPSA